MENVKEIELDRLQYVVHHAVDGHAKAHMTAHELTRRLGEAFVYEVKTEMAGECLRAENAKIRGLMPVEYVFSTKTGVAASWWQALKAQVLPRWLRRRWPPVFVDVAHKHTVRTWIRLEFEVGFETHAVYPQLPKILPTCGPHFYVRNSPMVPPVIADYVEAGKTSGPPVVDRLYGGAIDGKFVVDNRGPVKFEVRK